MGALPTITSAAPRLGGMVRRFWPQIRTQRWIISGAMGALVFQTLFRLAEPWPLKVVFDRILPNTHRGGRTHLAWLDGVDPGTLLLGCAGAVVLIALLRAVFAYLNTVWLALAGNRVLTNVRSELFNHLQHLSLTFHDKARTGDLLTRVVGDIGRLQEVAVTAALPMLINMLTLAGMLALMLWMDWGLALIALVALPLFVISARILGRQIHSAAREQREREGAMGATAAEALGAIRVVQSLALEDVHNKAFEAHNSASLTQGVKARRLSARLERTVDVVIALGMAGVLYFGARRVVSGVLSPGDLIVFIAYLKNAFKPMRDLAKYTGRLAKAAASAQRIVEILDAVPSVRDRPDAVEAPRGGGGVESIRFERVTFEYEPGRPALSDLDLEIRPGQMIALVGPSGAGKSTLISLLLRLHDPTSGRVLLDGQDIRGFTLKSYRSLISLVPQDTVLFGVSVRENIAYGDPSASREQIVEAARLARAHEFIEALPEGYETQLGERGETVSGGQRQRIAIARAIVRGAPILVFDEPTSNLDEANRAQVRAALGDLRRDRIVIVISHEPEAIGDADRIVLLDRGRIERELTPEDLRSQEPAVARLLGEFGVSTIVSGNGARHAVAR